MAPITCSRNVTTCCCCPFGFHLDLDFVKYCERLDATKNTSAPRKRRYGTQSMETMLGIKQMQNEQEKSSKRKHVEHNEYLPKCSLDYPLRNFDSENKVYKGASQAFLNFLDDVCYDFERAFEGSNDEDTTKTSEKNDFSIDQSQENIEQINKDIDELKTYEMNQPSLEQIRMQMVVSLARTRELEGQVKIISSLKDEVFFLKKEKHQLEQQIEKLKDQLISNTKDNDSKNVEQFQNFCSNVVKNVGKQNELKHSIGVQALPSTKSIGIQKSEVKHLNSVGVMAKPETRDESLACTLQFQIETKPKLNIDIGTDSIKVSTQSIATNTDNTDGENKMQDAKKFVSLKELDQKSFNGALKKNASVQCTDLKKNTKMLTKSTQHFIMSKNETTDTKDLIKLTNVSTNVEKIGKHNASVQCIDPKQNLKMITKTTQHNIVVRDGTTDTKGLIKHVDVSTYIDSPGNLKQYQELIDEIQCEPLQEETVLKINSEVARSDEISAGKKMNLERQNTYTIELNEQSVDDDILISQFQPSKEFTIALNEIKKSLQNKDSVTSSNIKNSFSDIIQKEWFKVCSTDCVNFDNMKYYLHTLKLYSNDILKFVVNLADENGNTAMHYAVSNSNFDLISMLLNTNLCNVNLLNNAGYTCVMLVSLAKLQTVKDRAVIQKLFGAADVNIPAKKHNQTALMLAVSHGNFEMVKLLLEAGAKINMQDNDGSTALMCATEHGRIDIVKLLLSYPECNSSIVDKDGNNALKISIEAGYRDIGILLYAHEKIRNKSLTSIKH